MKNHPETKAMIGVVLALLLASPSLGGTVEGVARPNIVVIMVDDLGYSDLGCYGSEIETPRLDELASQGLRFSQFYNTAKCHSSRVSLLTGQYCLAAGDTAMSHAVTSAEVLQHGGYFTAMTGKWHLKKEPTDFGFQRFFGHLSGACNFFKGDKTFRLNGERWKVPDSDFYTTVANVDYAIEFLKQARSEEQPWYLYLAFNAPHAPLHALPEDYAKYKGKYDVGWDSVRADRFSKQKEIGLLPKTLQVSPRPKHVRAWQDMEPWRQKYEANRMTTLAAMIDRVDQEVGRLVDDLKAHGEFENTLILFVSDNGACPYDRRPPRLNVEPTNGNVALPDSTGWAWARNTPFRYYKQNQFEGGISTPAIVHWPAGLKTKPGTVTDQPAHLIDVLPTLADVAGVPVPGIGPRRELRPVSGISLLPVLRKQTLKRDEPLHFLFAQDRGLREGDWKAVSFRRKPWELYNVAADRTELHDLADEQPERLKSMVEQWTRMTRDVLHARPNAYVAPSAADAEHRHPEWTNFDGTQPNKRAKGESKKRRTAKGERSGARPQSFMVAEHQAFMMNPRRSKRIGGPTPWVWYAPTFTDRLPGPEENWMIKRFHDQGIAVAGIDVGESYGSPAGRSVYQAFYEELTAKRGYSERPVLLARSRGGLMLYNWAVEHPNCVAGVAGIYPVCNIASYPGIEKAAGAYGLTAEQLKAQLTTQNPINRLAPLARAGVPILHIHGDEDRIVPLEANSAELERRYRSLGGPVKIEVIPGQGHNMWQGWFQSEKITSFVLAHALTGANSPIGNRLQPWAKNEWYWARGDTPVLLLGGSDDDNLFQWPSEKLLPQLDRIVRAGGNVIRNTMSDRQDLGLEVYPFLQREDGKYDLSQWNPEYWRRFETLLKETAKRDIVVQIEIWDRFDYTDVRAHDRYRWEKKHPYNPQNNVNYTSAASGLKTRYPKHPGANEQPFFFTTPKQQNNEIVLQYQTKFVDKLLEHTLPYDHILYCIDNETKAEPEWGEFWARHIKARAASAGKTICVTEMWDDWDLRADRHRQTFDHPQLYDFVDVSQNNHNQGQSHWDNFLFVREYLKGEPRPMNTTKTYGADGNKFKHSDQDAIERFWRHLLAGAASIRFHRPSSGLGINDKAVACIRAARLLEKEVPLWELNAADAILENRSENEAYVAANQDRTKLAVFFPAADGKRVRIVSVALPKTQKSYVVRWIDIDRGEFATPFQDLQTFSDLSPPSSGNAVALIVAP